MYKNIEQFERFCWHDGCNMAGMTITRTTITDYAVTTDTMLADGSYSHDGCCKRKGMMTRFDITSNDSFGLRLLAQISRLRYKTMGYAIFAASAVCGLGYVVVVELAPIVAIVMKAFGA